MMNRLNAKINSLCKAMEQYYRYQTSSFFDEYSPFWKKHSAEYFSNISMGLKVLKEEVEHCSSELWAWECELHSASWDSYLRGKEEREELLKRQQALFLDDIEITKFIKLFKATCKMYAVEYEEPTCWGNNYFKFERLMGEPSWHTEKLDDNQKYLLSVLTEIKDYSPSKQCEIIVNSYFTGSVIFETDRKEEWKTANRILKSSVVDALREISPLRARTFSNLCDRYEKEETK